MALISSVLKSPINSVLQNVFDINTRFVYNFDGVDDYATLGFRAINPDGDIDIEFWSPSGSAAVFIISQNISATESAREFNLWRGGAGELRVTFGGVSTTLLSAAQGFKSDTKYGLSLIGATARVFEGGLNGTLVRSTGFTRGTAREPTAQTIIGCRGNNAGSFTSFFQGPQYDIKINGVLYPMSDRNQPIQLPSPSNLGAELITQSVLENPAVKGSQWTYLGNGRWQLVGDGSFNELNFILPANQHGAGYLEFEVESITGQMRCAVNSSNNPVNSIFTTTGFKRYYYSTKDNAGAVNGNCIQFVRLNAGFAASCVIKNISFKPLYTTNTAQLVTNGDFSAGATRWTVGTGASIANGELTINNPTTSSTFQSIATSNGEWYEVTYTVKSISSGEVRFILYGTGTQRLGTARTTAGTYTEAVRLEQLGGSFNNTISIQGSFLSATNAVIDNVSVRKIDSICNPMTLVNTSTDRWQEVDA